MADILHSFRLKFPRDREPIMYSELSDGSYAKTYELNDDIIVEFIDLPEYATALASFLLRLD